MNIKLLARILLIFLPFIHISSHALSGEIKLESDIAYGKSKDQKLDVYYPSIKTKNAPVIFMVHGGAWRVGDKASKAVVKNKVKHWVSKGFVFISTNYRMLPSTDPIKQAEDVKKAFLFAKQEVYKWSGSSEKIIMMGHSAGAHLVSLVATQNHRQIEPWLGTVALDSAAYDVVRTMNEPSPPKLYKKAFGRSPAYWREASPFHTLSNKLPPFLAVCSSQREERSCSQASSFVEKAKRYGTSAKLLRADFSHRGINIELGKDYCYTKQVDEFLKTLDPSIESILSNESASYRQFKAKQRCSS